MSVAATARQTDAMRELAHLGSSQAAAMLAKLVGDVGVLVEVPVIFETRRANLGWLFGGRDVQVVAALFGIEGEVKGHVWWVLRRDHAVRLTQRLARHPGAESTDLNAALAEAANIVASACVSAVSTMLHAHLLPSTPEVHETTVGTLAASPVADDVEFTVFAASFLSTNAPTFGGWLVLMFDEKNRSEMVQRLGV